jgi:hypothetical protein
VLCLPYCLGTLTPAHVNILSNLPAEGVPTLQEDRTVIIMHVCRSAQLINILELLRPSTPAPAPTPRVLKARRSLNVSSASERQISRSSVKGQLNSSLLSEGNSSALCSSGTTACLLGHSHLHCGCLTTLWLATNEQRSMFGE